MTKGYNLYGLRINSEFQLNGFKEKKAYVKADVIVEIGKVNRPKDGIENTTYYDFTVYNEEIYYQDIPSIVKFCLSKGEKLTIELYQPLKRNAALFYLYDSMLPIILLNHNIYPLYASAVNTNEGVYLFSGGRGDGKSTIATSLCMEGYKLISDDICILKWNEHKNELETKCYFPHTNIWRDTARILGKKAKKYKIRQIRNGVLKYSIDFSKNSLRTFRPVIGMVILKVENFDKPLEIEKIKGIAKMDICKKVIHSNYYVSVISKQKELFKHASQIAKQISITKINRSRITTHPELKKFVINEIFGKTTT